MLARGGARLELLERTQLLALPFEGVVEFGLVFSVGSGGLEAGHGSVASEEESPLGWALLSIEVDNEMLDLMRDRDCGEKVVGSAVDAA